MQSMEMQKVIFRFEWFHIAAIQSIGEINMENYVAFNKTRGKVKLTEVNTFSGGGGSQAFTSKLLKIMNLKK